MSRVPGKLINSEQLTFILQNKLRISDDQPGDPRPPSVQPSDSGVGQFEGVLVGGHGDDLYPPLLATLHAVVNEGERENVDIRIGLKHQVLYHQQLHYVRTNMLEEGV